MLDLELLAVREMGVNGMSVCLKPKIPVVITPGLVNEIRQLQNSLADKYLSNVLNDYFYIVWFLEDRRGLGCRGLDFNFIVNCIKKNHETKLESYISGIFDLLFLNRVGLGFPIINCSIVNRALTGLSKEFFFLNKICFIRNNAAPDIQKINIFNELSPFLLGKELYENNHYFYFHALQLDRMRLLIEDIDYEVPTVEEVNQIKNHFESMKKATMKGIYDIAERNIKVLERMAKGDLKLCPQES
ncbi:hypothetical protein [Legionella fallonii]|uniref:Uncharacterized protein n=1 Tax=Legionella fallonii LLAP-10 TaxID=1212491 RepID=A0A098G3U1_9GAMM|nr:hypothetical protein [Legionella fallonii]CEG56646.1 protein of unknown function [Legionella fallonii LLAP-10]